MGFKMIKLLVGYHYLKRTVMTLKQILSSYYKAIPLAKQVRW